ncbi:MAG: hypothetical protein SRB1_02471 [Desulfobacteraceae bacterium Eth-SRB1]|nr:MAG: hypothetical protein SRB1_02471 [Desulfobacteraceae bacterium Eth-SRB1]
MEGKAKRLYNKPKISKVRLLPEEAVLQNCKALGSNKGAATNKCSAGACNSRLVGS